MSIKFFLAGFLFIGLFFGDYNVVIAESEESEAQESEGAGESEGGGEAASGEGAAAGAAAGSVVPPEVQQQVDSAQDTVNTVSEKVQSVQEKGFLQTVWDTITAPIAALFEQVGQIIRQILSMFGV